MSVLQILAAVINYIVMRLPNDCHAIHYDLEMKIGLTEPELQKLKSKHKSTSYLRGLRKPNWPKSISIDYSEGGIGGTSYNSSYSLHGDDSPEIDDSEFDQDDESDPEAARNRKFHHQFDIEISTLTKDQKAKIRQKRECKASFRKWLCQEMAFRVNTIEIGYVTLTPKGCIIHIVHYTFESEAKAFHDAQIKKLPTIPTDDICGNIELQDIEESEQVALKFNSTTTNTITTTETDGGRWNVGIKEFEKTAKSFFKDLYKRNRDRVECAFASHFDFKEERVNVFFHKRYPYSPYDMENKHNFSYENLCVGDSDDEGEPNDANHHNNGHGFDIGKNMHNGIKRLPAPPKIAKPERPEIYNIDKPLKMEMAASNASDNSEHSLRSMSTNRSTQHTPTEELASTMNQIQLLTLKIQQKALEHEDEGMIKQELINEGWNETIIDKVMELAKLGKSIRITTEDDGNESVDSDVEYHDEEDVKERHLHVNDVFDNIGTTQDDNDEDTGFPDVDDHSPLYMPSPKVIKRHPLPSRIAMQETKTEEKGNEEDDNKDDGNQQQITILGTVSSTEIEIPSPQQISTPQISHMNMKSNIDSTDNIDVGDDEQKITDQGKQNTDETSVDEDDEEDENNNNNNKSKESQNEVENNKKDILIDTTKLKSND